MGNKTIALFLQKGGGRKDYFIDENEIFGKLYQSTPKEVLRCQAKKKVTGVNF